jgi:hypothetical protein
MFDFPAVSGAKGHRATSGLEVNLGKEWKTKSHQFLVAVKR